MSMFGFKELLSKGKEMMSDIQNMQRSKAAPAPSAAEQAAEYPGRELLARHEKSWDLISANNAKLAHMVTVDEAAVRNTAGRCEAELAAWGRLQQELEALAGVGDSVDTLRAEMEALCGQLMGLDTALDKHLEAREEKDLWRWKAELERDTDMFESSREREVRLLERQLKADQAKRLRATEAAKARAAAEAKLAETRAAEAKQAEARAAAAHAAKKAEAEEAARKLEELGKLTEAKAAGAAEAEAKAEAKAEAGSDAKGSEPASAGGDKEEPKEAASAKPAEAAEPAEPEKTAADAGGKEEEKPSE